MEVVLGPAAGAFRAGTSTRRGSISGIMSALLKEDPLLWAAAHLLNADFGGDGLAPENLAPMTQTANKQHGKLEKKVKDACTLARQKHELNGLGSYYYGVKYSVATSAVTFGDFSPYNKVPSHMVVNVSVARFTLDGMTETPLTAKESSWFGTYTYRNKEVHNRDEHLNLG